MTSKKTSSAKKKGASSRDSGSKNKHFFLHAGTYDFTYHVFVGTDFDAMTKYVRHQFDEPNWSYHFEHSLGCLIYKFNYQPVIWLRHKPKTPREFGTLAHEVFHLVCYILDRWAGMTLRHEVSEEAYGHLTGKIVTDILTKLK